MENDTQRDEQVDALCPECGHGFKHHMDRMLGDDPASQKPAEINCPVCGCGDCTIGK